MDENRHSNSKFKFIVSTVDDGVIVETVFRPGTGDTALVVASGNDIAIVPTWRLGDVTYRPVRPSNSLIAHAALLFPSEPAEFGTTKKLLGDIEAYIRRYVLLSDSAAASSAAYVLLSWVYDAFNELPYLRFRGDYGTGKTRALSVIGSLCYKVFFASGASTVSPIFHTLDTFKGTLVFDEADFRFSDEKADLVKILNNGNAKGFPVLRTQVTPQKEFDPRAFSIFGPKIVGMRRSYDDRALESRFLTIEMEPGRAAGVPLNLPDEQKDEALALRNKLLLYRLRHRLSVALDPGLVDPYLEPRMNQIVLPLLSVLPDETHRVPIRIAMTTLQAGVVLERGTTVEGQVLSILTKLRSDEAQPAPSLANIATAFTAEFGAEYERPVTNRWIGSVLRRLGIMLYKNHGAYALSPGQGERIEALCGRYGIVIPIEENATA